MIFLSDFGFLSLQIWQTVQTFIEKRSTLAVSKETFDYLMPPTIVFCLPSQWDIFLNEKINITFTMRKPNVETESLTYIKKNLTLGENYDDQNKLMLTVGELTHPWDGLCYTLAFNENHEMSKMDMHDWLHVDIEFAQGMEMPKVEVSLVSSADNYGFILQKQKKNVP